MNYTHDCAQCVPLGEHKNDIGKYDLYICPDKTHGFHSVIARYGNNGSEYSSFGVDSNVLALFAQKPDYVLAAAYREAVKAGFVFSS